MTNFRMKSVRIISFIVKFIFLFSYQTTLLAQKQADNWFFGERLGLSFGTGEPIPISGSQMLASEGCISLSDSNGHLLFYSNGGPDINDSLTNPASSVIVGPGGIWDRTHNIMKGAEGMIRAVDVGGSFDATQSSIAFPKPETPHIYCLLTIDDSEIAFSGRKGRGLRYFEIDMKSNQGNGEVQLFNQPVIAPTFEFLAATKHQNKKDYWVAVFEYNFAISGFDQLHIFLINSNGIHPHAQYDLVTFGLSKQGGRLFFSPDGSKLLIGSVLLAFDKQLGSVSLVKNEMIDFATLNRPFSPKGFSPNSSFVYMVDSEQRLVRFDLNNSDIGNSEEVIFDFEHSTNQRSGDLTDFQLASNGNLYFLYREYPGFALPNVFVSEIQCPNSREVLPVVRHKIWELAFERYIPQNFPSYVDHIFAYQGLVPIDIGSDTTICKGDTLLIEPLTNFSCEFSYSWSDGSVGENFLITDPGTYWVEAVNECGVERDTIVVVEADDCCQCFIPSAFSPNLDRNNDKFHPITNCEMASYSFEIYNRWGKRIFYTENPQEAWEGMEDGGQVEEGVYAWVVDYQFETREKEVNPVKRYGTVTLIR